MEQWNFELFFNTPFRNFIKKTLDMCWCQVVCVFVGVVVAVSFMSANALLPTKLWVQDWVVGTSFRVKLWVWIQRLGAGFKSYLFSPDTNWSNLTNMFQMGWRDLFSCCVLLSVKILSNPLPNVEIYVDMFRWSRRWTVSVATTVFWCKPLSICEENVVLLLWSAAKSPNFNMFVLKSCTHQFGISKWREVI